MVKVRTSLVKQAVLARLSRKRQSTAHTKTRGEVRGGGAKPWRQKGTGRARAGSRRSPIWVGGGTVFGPRRERNFKVKLPRKMSRAAIREILRLKKKADRLLVLTSIDVGEPRTKAALALIGKLKLLDRKVLFVTEEMKPELLVACDNLETVSVIQAKDLTVTDLINDATVVIENKPLEKLFGITDDKKPRKKDSAVLAQGAKSARGRAKSKEK